MTVTIIPPLPRTVPTATAAPAPAATPAPAPAVAGEAPGRAGERRTGLQIVERLLRAYEEGDDGVVDELCAPGMVEHPVRRTWKDGCAQLKGSIRETHAHVHDLEQRVEDWTEDGETVWVRTTGRGHVGRRRVETTTVDIARIQDGQIVEHWRIP